MDVKISIDAAMWSRILRISSVLSISPEEVLADVLTKGVESFNDRVPPEGSVPFEVSFKPPVNEEFPDSWKRGKEQELIRFLHRFKISTMGFHADVCSGHIPKEKASLFVEGLLDRFWAAEMDVRIDGAVVSLEHTT